MSGENRKEVFFKAIGYRAEAENVCVRLQMNFPLAEEGMKNSRDGIHALRRSACRESNRYRPGEYPQG